MHYFDNFWHTSVNVLSQACFIFYIKSKAENQLKFNKYNVPWLQYVHVRKTVKLLRCETTNFIIAPNSRLLNISDFSPVDYRIFAMLQELVCQHPICRMSISWGNVWLTDRDGHWSSDWSVGIWADGMSYGQRWTFWTFDIVKCFIIALHCWSIRFHHHHHHHQSEIYSAPITR